MNKWNSTVRNFESITCVFVKGERCENERQENCWHPCVLIFLLWCALSMAKRQWDLCSMYVSRVFKVCAHFWKYIHSYTCIWRLKFVLFSTAQVTLYFLILRSILWDIKDVPNVEHFIVKKLLNKIQGIKNDNSGIIFLLSLNKILFITKGQRIFAYIACEIEIE